MDVTQNIDRVKQLKSVYNDIGKMISDEERFIEQERKAMKNKKRKFCKIIWLIEFVFL